MKLLVDIGNTRIKYIVVENSQSIQAMQMRYVEHQLLSELLVSGAFVEVTEVIVANVQCNELAIELELWAAKREIRFLQVHSESYAYGVTSSYQQPEKLGVDRWLALIATQQLYPKYNTLIIDAGTAITVDLLADNGLHLGGWIMPGLQTMFDSLLGNTQKIFAEKENLPQLSFGTNSSECVNFGCWAMVVGAINNAITQAETILSLDKVIITGGNSEQIAEHMPNQFELIPELLFHGLDCFKAT